MKKNLFVISMLALMTLSFFAFGCGSDDGAEAEVPSDEDTCANFENVCEGSSAMIDCKTVIDSQEDCQKKCAGYGSDCTDILACMTMKSGDLYTKYCESDNNDEDDDSKKKLPARDCLESSCSSDYDGCNNNADCVSLWYCIEDCNDCTDNCDTCEDTCSSDFRTGTGGMSALARCAQERGCESDWI